MRRVLPLLIVAVASGCPSLTTYTTSPGPREDDTVACDDAFLDALAADLAATTLLPVFLDPYPGFADGCATCHGGGTPDGASGGWGPDGDLTADGWTRAILALARRSDLADLDEVSLVEVFARQGEAHHPANPTAHDEMRTFLGELAGGCGDGAPADAGVDDAGVDDAGPGPDAGGGGLDAGLAPPPDGGACPPLDDAASAALLDTLGLTAKYAMCASCHRLGPTSPSGRNEAWGTGGGNDAAAWRDAFRGLEASQGAVALDDDRLVQVFAGAAAFGAPHADDATLAAAARSWLSAERGLVCPD